MLFFNSDTKPYILKWLNTVISANLERTKLYFNPHFTSTSGFLFNITSVLIKMLFDIHNINKSKNNLLQLIQQIEPLYCITTSPIDFGKFDKVNPDIIKEFVASFENDLPNGDDFNDTTILYFMIHILLSYFIKSIDDEYARTMGSINELYTRNETHDTKL